MTEPHSRVPSQMLKDGKGKREGNVSHKATVLERLDMVWGRGRLTVCFLRNIRKRSVWNPPGRVRWLGHRGGTRSARTFTQGTRTKHLCLAPPARRPHPTFPKTAWRPPPAASTPVLRGFALHGLATGRFHGKCSSLQPVTCCELMESFLPQNEQHSQFGFISKANYFHCPEKTFTLP